MCTGSFLSIRLPELLLLITLSYRCHPRTSPCFAERCYHRHSFCGAPALLLVMLQVQLSSCTPKEGPQKLAGVGWGAGTLIPGCPLGMWPPQPAPSSRRTGDAQSSHTPRRSRGTSTVPSPSLISPSLFEFCLLCREQAGRPTPSIIGVL